MIVDEELASQLYNDAGYNRYTKGKRYFEEKRVEIYRVLYGDEENFEIYSNVKGHNQNYNVYIKIDENEIDDVRCECPDYENNYCACKHIVATMLEFQKNKMYENKILCSSRKVLETKDKYRDFKEIMNSFYDEINDIMKEEKKDEIVKEHNIKIEPKFTYDKYSDEIKVDFKIGNKQMYKLKNLRDFYDLIQNKENYRYGAKLEFIHEEESFENESKELLNFILKYSEIIKRKNISKIIL